ncbi:phosphate/phosphite/phosphonate ABC transporter substrate-binding protein [Desulfosporosinus metallidurans]|uniref:Phosphonate ABC transporter phosphate-binding periplasmic component n=1 Tax=Desulfosporosinus metallidurans TaxID=1888891 RepID=A0A1Q8QZZ2_9FIRM|nr:phosphate/phosphite/phosphonate ABC transporter substrate-binding protein [Desulfosporosinus metallidurans]OLN32949.1 Phosphonate ABC transporter phosphate-binding periplasmic component [Desulfosporosinus metallidurans]
MSKVRLLVLSMILLLLPTMGCSTITKENVIPLTTKDQTPVVAKRDVTSSVYTFSFDRRMDPAEDVKMYAPFLEYLERTTGYNFKLRPMAQNQNLIEELGTGRVDIAAIGTLSYLKAHQKYGVRAVVRGITEQGKAEYRALIITSTNSNLRSLSDLRGKTFTFGSDTSTQGYLIPLIMLTEAGVKLTDLTGYTFAGSHFDTANAVISGKYAAGGIQDTLGRELANKGLVRILAESEEFPSSTISVSPSLPTEVVKKVQEALLKFAPEGKDKGMLYHWDQTEMPLGFVSTDDKDFEKARIWAVRLGLFNGGTE